MPASFIESPRFPDNISYGSSGGPGFRTTIFEGHSAEEQRGVNWDRSKARYNVSYDVRDIEDMAVVRRFFYALRGRAVGFRFKDHADYQLVQEVIGVGNGVNLVFKLTATYTVGTETYVRRIFKPVPTSIDPDAPFIVRVDGNVINASNYTVDFTTGIITFDGGQAPGNGLNVDVTCHFDVPVRFDTDVLQPSHEGFSVESLSGVPLVEIMLKDAADPGGIGVATGMTIVSGQGTVLLDGEGEAAGVATVDGEGEVI